jgi:hypothetical protein
MKCKHPNGASVPVATSGDVRGLRNAVGHLQREVRKETTV